jgi:hypothetical protein
MNQKMIVVGADTDGLAFKKADQKPFTPEERASLLEGLNSLMDELIRFEDDGVVKKQICVRAKNYILVDESGKVKIKGSALKATTKEKALQRFIAKVIELIIADRMDQIYSVYNACALEILNLKDIGDWCSKKTVTKAVLTGTRTNETRVLDAIGSTPVQEGDKIYVFFKTPTELCLRENFDGIYDVSTLLGKLYDSLCVFDTIIQTDLFPNYSLKRNMELLTGEKPAPVRSKAPIKMNRMLQPELLR